MKLSQFVYSHQAPCEALDRFLRGQYGGAYVELEAAALDERFDDFKKAVANHARNLYGDERLKLYQEVSDLVAALKSEGLTRKTYNLSQSFLGDDEIDLIILKVLHQPMSQDDLANNVLKCSRQAVGDRILKLQDGLSLVDMKVSIAPSYGGKLESTVHPILLPLNLSEVYVLLSQLKKTAVELDEFDPHACIAKDLSEKIYFQLSDYARSRIDGRLSEAGLLPRGVTAPIFEGDTRPSGDSARWWAHKSFNWVYFEKSGQQVKVTWVDSDGVDRESVGMLVSRYRPEQHDELLGGRNPASCFALRRADDSFEVLSWADVIDIEKA